MSSHGGPGPRPKVVRIIEQYALEGIGDELEHKWTRDEDRMSLRALADEFNERLVERALHDAAVDTLTEDSSYIYAVLNGDAGTSGEQTQLKRRLERDGVDVDALTSDFVTYQAIRSYLTNIREASAPTKDDETIRDNAADTIAQLRERTAAVTESKLAGLESSDRLTLGEHRVRVDVRVFCEDCGKQYDVGTLLENGSCGCNQ